MNKLQTTGTLTNGLVGHWTFEDPDLATDGGGVLTAYDQSGQGNNGTSTAAANTPARISGKLGQGALFSGTQGLSAGYGSSLTNLGPMSVSVWVKESSQSTSNQVIVPKRQSVVSARYRVEFVFFLE